MLVGPLPKDGRRTLAPVGFHKAVCWGFLPLCSTLCSGVQFPKCRKGIISLFKRPPQSAGASKEIRHIVFHLTFGIRQA